MGVRPITGAVGGEGGRPMTAVRAAGFTSQPGRGNYVLVYQYNYFRCAKISDSNIQYIQRSNNVLISGAMFDPLGQANKAAAPPLEGKSEDR